MENDSDGKHKAKYKRIILKLSGEALRNSETGEPIDAEILQAICNQIKEIHEMGVQIGLVAKCLEKLVVVIEFQQRKCLIDRIDMRFTVFRFTGAPSFCR